jgi:PAS domain S-box-containing protein
MFRRLRLRAKLIGAFAIMLAVIVAFGIISSLASEAALQTQKDVDHHQRVIDHYNDVLWSVSQIQTTYRSYLMFGDVVILAQHNSAVVRFEESFESLKRSVLLDPDQFGRIVSIEQDVRDWRNDVIRPGMDIRTPGNTGDPEQDAAAINYLQRNESISYYRVITEQLEDGLAAETALLQDLEGSVARSQRILSATLIGGSIAAIVVGVALSTLLSRDIVGAVQRLGTQAGRIASGDLHSRIRSKRGDEIGRVASLFDTMADQLEERTVQLKETATIAEERALRIRAIVDNVADGLISFRDDGIITSCNPAARAIFATDDCRDMIGTPIQDYMRKDGADEQLSIECLLPHDGKPLLRDVRGVRSDGMIFPAEVLVQEIADSQDRELIGVIRDVSERREAEERLREQVRVAQRAETQTRAVLDATGDAIVVANDDTEAILANQPFADFFQTTEENILGMNTAQLLGAAGEIVSDIDHVTRIVMRGLENPDERVIDTVSLVWPEKRDLAYLSVPVRTVTDERVGRLYAFHDITHQRELDRMKDEFVSLVSHELRTPLTSIKGYVDLLLDEDMGDLSEDQRDFLQTVRSNAQRLVTMVNELLDLSRIESGKMELRIEPTDLAPLAQRVVTQLSPLIAEKNHDVVIDADPVLRLAAVDADRMTQILTNLISNAVKYTPSGGRVTISLRNDADAVVVSIRDTGVGLDESDLLQLFTRFFRARNRITREVSGTGLGLSITRMLVEMHGGSITVESVPGEGSTFTVTVPAAAPVSVAHPDPLPDSTVSVPGGTILLVEDDADIARLIAQYLSRSGHTVHIAPDAATALELARRNRFDLITLDVVLPDIDGFSLLDVLRDASNNQRVPVMMLSMLPDDGSAEAHGANDYMEKPVLETELMERISRLLVTNQVQTVLVADDDDDLRKVITRELERLGHRTVEAADGRQAIERVYEQPVDLILLDVRMPRMDGIVTLEALRASPHTRDIPVILMTGDELVLQGRVAGMDESSGTEMLSKSMSPRDIASIIHRALEAQGVSGA